MSHLRSHCEIRCSIGSFSDNLTSKTLLCRLADIKQKRPKCRQSTCKLASTEPASKQRLITSETNRETSAAFAQLRQEHDRAIVAADNLVILLETRKFIFTSSNGVCMLCALPECTWSSHMRYHCIEPLLVWVCFFLVAAHVFSNIGYSEMY